MTKYKINNYIAIISIIVALIGIFIIECGCNILENETAIYSYNVQKSDDYEVLLKPNNFYEEEKLPSGKYYASNSIKAYLINLKYNFKGNKKTSLEYSYNVVANLIGTAKNSNNEEKEVWNRQFIIYDYNYNKKENADEFFITSPINIDYEYYNNLARAYENEYKIPINAVLKIRFNIYYDINLSSFGSNFKRINDFIELNIPITNTVSEVTQNYEPTFSDQITLNVPNASLYIIFIIGTVFILGALALFIISTIRNRKTPKEIYNAYLKHIFKYYGSLIVTVNSKPDLTNLKIIKISILDDLIDIAEQSQSNIIYYNLQDEEKDIFYVILNGYVYIYEVSQ